MDYLLDTNIVSTLYDRSAKGHLQILEKLRTLHETDSVGISILTLYELEYGLANAPKKKKALVQLKVQEAQASFQVLPLSRQGAPAFAFLKKSLQESQSLKKKSLQRHNVDLLLAATCLVEDRVLVSSDLIFEALDRAVPSLKVENWIVDESR